ncbi:MAG TPA: ABC transporter permease [Chryseolinea sp.]|nr:ABC transporter permease [Chryseolinea sp.]
MIKSYVLLFMRNLKRQKLFSTINLLGLTVSIASTLIIYLFVSHELSYDSFHPNVERLYRVNQTFIWSEDRTNQFSRTGPGVAHAMIEELPEVEMVSSFHTPGDFIITYVSPSGEVIAFEENKVLAADSNFFKVFNYPLISGDEISALMEANSLLMTQSTARKYFGTENPVGKMVQLSGLNGGQGQTFQVAGVLENTPDNSTMEFEVLLSMKSFPQVGLRYWSWVWTQLETFVLLRADADIDKVREKLKAIPRKRAEESIRGSMGVTYDEYIKSGKSWDLFLQPITKLHMPDDPVIGSFPNIGNRKTVYSFIGAAIFIALLSCINFMNLSTAQFTRRIKEVSVRKILGLGKKELSLSYFFEALTFCFMALLVAIALSQLLLPGFNLITGKNLTLSLFNNPKLIILLVTLTGLMAILSSSYPAIFLTGFNPARAIKGKSKVGREGKNFRNGLVIFQFSVSIVLMICTAVVFQQLKYVSEKDLGFDRDNLVVLHHAEAVKNGETLVNTIRNIPGVVSASWCTSAPPTVYGGDTFSAENTNDMKLPLNYTMADENYIPTLGIKLRYGRNFETGNPSDSMRVVLNESAVYRIGWTMDESVIGKHVTYPNSGTTEARFEVVGVIYDFNYWSISSPIEPLAIFNPKNKYIGDGDRRYLVVKLKTQNVEAWNATLLALSDKWKQQAGDTPFQYSFVDENFAKTFSSQQQFGKVLTVMASLAILIACLGLLGMIVYSLEQRTKEIGIRKVSGASVYNILVLISKGYTKLILVAFVIGAPVAYYIMNFWLMDFAYAIKPSVWIFILTGASILVLAVVITCYHSLKAALTNPVDVLRDE